MSYDFDSPINVPDQESREFFVFEDGDEVNYEVTDFQKAISSNNNPMAKLELRLYDDEGNESKAFERLVLCEKMAWMLKQFFVSVGQADPEDKVLNPDWNKVKGATGRCKVEVEVYDKNGQSRRINRVAQFLEPSDAGTQTREQSEPKFDFN